MAKIRNSNPKQSGGGYERLVGDKDMASIFTKAQSTVISNGTELEKIISNRSNTITEFFCLSSARYISYRGTYLLRINFE